MKKFTIGICAFLLISANIFAQTWSLQTSGVTTAINSAWAVNDQVVWMCGPGTSTSQPPRVLRTTNGGTTWTNVSTGITAGQGLYTIAAVDANICITGSDDGTLWRTTNGGANWTWTAPTPSSPFINVVHMFNATTGFAQGDPFLNIWGYWVTTDAGATWTGTPNHPSSVGSEAGWNNSYCALDTGHIWWGTNSTKIWRGGLRGPFTSATTNGIVNSYGVWFNDANTGIAIMNNATSSTANQRSTNGGATWTATSFTPSVLTYALKGVPGTTFMWIGGGGTTSGNIWRSTDAGATFTAQTFSSAGPVYAMTFVHQGLGWVGCSNGSIYKYTDPNYTGVNNQNEIPSSFKLEQNYPNPFNPTTNINYSIPSGSNVTMKLYDMLGHEVMTLVDGYMNAGNHVAIVDGSNLSSGVYFYKIVAGSFTDTKKMTLMK